MDQWNILYFGSPQNAADLLEKLDRDKRFQIVAVVTQPDRPVGREQKFYSTPVAQFAEMNNVSTLKPDRDPNKKYLLKNPKKLKKHIQTLTPQAPDPKKSLDLLLVYEFGQLIPQQILDIPRFGGINIHFSLLPAYRGASPLPWQIVNGEKQTGITLVKMNEKFDKGDIVYQEARPIKPDDTTATLHARLSRRVLKLIPDVLPKYLEGKLPLKKPKKTNYPSSYYPRLTRDDGYIRWDNFLSAISGDSPRIARETHRKLRAFHPWPGIWTRVESRVESGALDLLTGKRLKILSAKLDNDKLVPLKAQLSGQKPKSWSRLKTDHGFPDF